MLVKILLTMFSWMLIKLFFTFVSEDLVLVNINIGYTISIYQYY